FVRVSGRKIGRSFDLQRGWSGPASAMMTLTAAALKHASRRCRGGQLAMLDRSLAQRQGVIRPGRRNGLQPNQETVAGSVLVAICWAEPRAGHYARTQT